jgi:hypothetical protein
VRGNLFQLLKTSFGLNFKGFARRIISSYTGRFIMISVTESKAIPLQAWTGPKGPRRLKDPRFQDNRHMKVVRLTVLRTGRLYPQEIFQVLISVRGCLPQGHSAAGRIISMKNSNGTVGNRSRDFPVCSTVHQPLRHRVPDLHSYTRKELALCML